MWRWWFFLFIVVDAVTVPAAAWWDFSASSQLNTGFALVLLNVFMRWFSFTSETIEKLGLTRNISKQFNSSIEPYRVPLSWRNSSGGKKRRLTLKSVRARMVVARWWCWWSRHHRRCFCCRYPVRMHNLANSCYFFSITVSTWWIHIMPSNHPHPFCSAKCHGKWKVTSEASTCVRTG